MIIVETKHFKHKYRGNIIIEFRDSMILIEEHYTEPHNRNDEDDLPIWVTDTYDWFWIEDVISITGVE